jgi:hypothetical protein
MSQLAIVAENCGQLDARQERAAKLIAANKLTDREIAQKCRISQRTLDYWKTQPAFVATVSANRQHMRQRIMTSGLADKVARVDLLNAMAQDIMRQLRDNDYQRAEVKLAANGEHLAYQVFDKARVDSLRGLLDDLAAEVGDRQKTVNVRTTIEQAADLLAREYGLTPESTAKLVDIATRRQSA